MNDLVMTLDDVGKRYVKYEDAPLLITRALRFRAQSRRTHLWAVRHVNLAVAPGETVGVIGRNGSGKSTMLRMLAGVTAPTEGVVRVRGRVAPLLSVGVGFHLELTGRENVYVNGVVLGMPRAEIDRLFDSIVAFAEIEEFIDTPVKFYSSGMLVRLGFSVAVAARPEVLLVDEVLAVGDVAFQQKCFERMEEMRDQGTSVLVVSHNLNSVRLLCHRTMLLHNGDQRFLGPTEEAISMYHDLLAVPMDANISGPAGAPVRVLGVSATGENGRATSNFGFGERVDFEMDAEFLRAWDSAAFSFLVTNERGQVVYSEHTRPGEVRFRAGERARFRITMPATLPTGTYRARAGIQWDADTEHRTGKTTTFFVSGRLGVKGLADLQATLSVVGENTHGERLLTGDEAPPLEEQALGSETVTPDGP
jgi:ABC-type polysaccharide/polyol phosphate transport system ATPase subunit